MALLLVTAAVLVCTYFFLPPPLERIAVENIRRELHLENVPKVELERGSPPDVLAGRFTEGRVTMDEVGLDGLRAERVVVDLDPFDVGLLKSLASGKIETGEPLSGALVAEIPEEEVSRLARAGSDVPVRDVELHRGRMLVRSTAPLFGVEVPVSVQGRLVLRGRELVFEPQRVEALGSLVPEGLTEQALAGTNYFAYPLEGLPYGAQISDVEVQEGSLILSGEVERIVLGRPGG